MTFCGWHECAFLFLAIFTQTPRLSPLLCDAADGRWDISVCLGDVVGYGPDPHEVVARLREMGTQTIRGNHDKAVAGLMDTDDFNPVGESRCGLDSRAIECRRSRLAIRVASRTASHRRYRSWYMVRFKTKTNTSSHPRKLSMACLTPPPK